MSSVVGFRLKSAMLVECFMLGLAIAFIATNTAAADARKQMAEDAYIKARRDYYQALKSGKAKTPQERRELYKSTVGAAEKKFGQLIAQSWKEAVERRTKPGFRDPNIEIDAQTWKKAQAEMGSGAGESNEPTVISSHSGEGGAENVAGSETTRPAKTETALDGSNVPRLLEFSGKKKPAENR